MRRPDELGREDSKALDGPTTEAVEGHDVRLEVASPSMVAPEVASGNVPRPPEP